MALATGFAPAHGCVSLQEYNLSTCAVVKGQVLSVSGGGYLTDTVAITSAVQLVAVSAETKNGAGTGRSALTSTTTDGLHKVLAWPIHQGNRFETLTSGAVTATDVGETVNITAAGTGVEEAVETQPNFLIEELVDSTNRRVRGRFISNSYVGRI